MIYRVIISCLVVVLIAPTSSSQQQNTIKHAYKVRDVAEFDCCGVDLEISLFTDAIRAEREARAYVVGYSGPDDPPGKMLRYLGYIESNLAGVIRDTSHPVTVVNGGQRNRFAIEMWIVPKGASEPVPGGSTDEPAAGQSPYLFDQSEAGVMEYGKDSYIHFGLACTLSYPRWEEFFRILRDTPAQRGHVIIYVGHQDPARRKKRIEGFLRAFLKKEYANEVPELTMAYGGKREWSQIEIWVARKGQSDPSPTPRPGTVGPR